jgi:hypothetical protein
LFLGCRSVVLLQADAESAMRAKSHLPSPGSGIPPGTPDCLIGEMCEMIGVQLCDDLSVGDIRVLPRGPSLGWTSLV